MKTCFSTLLLIGLSSVLTAQHVVFEEGDTTYQVGVKSDSSEYMSWEFKSDLPKGKYWAVSKSECGVDTLAYAEFVVDGVKHGKWFENAERVCAGLIDEEKNEVSDWFFFNNSERWSETVYDTGFIKSHTWIFYDSGKSKIKFFYPDGAREVNEWNREHRYFESGKLMRSLEVRVDKSRFEKTYYESGNLASEGVLYLPNEDTWSTTFFHENGQVKARGQYGRYVKGGKETWILTHYGKWVYLDETGKWIAKAWFENGDLLKSRVKKAVNKTIWEIHEMTYY